MSTCTKPSENIDFTINICIHVFILFTILSMFFMFYISKLETKTFGNEIQDAINNGVQSQYDALSIQNKVQLHQIFKNVNIDTIIANYSTPAEVVTVNNKFLFNTIILTDVFLLILIIGLSYIIKKSCQQCVPIWTIILENVVIFVFIAIVEFAFFNFIAIKFIPVLPSTLTTTTISALKTAVSV